VAQDSFNGSLMQFHFELIEDQVSDGRSREVKLGSLIDDVADDLRSKLVRLCFTFGFFHQACQAFLSKGLQGLVEGFTTIAEFSTDPSDKALVVAVSPKHLVLYLCPILGLKEIGVNKQLRLDSFGIFLAGHRWMNISDGVKRVKYN
jgi:hypothetical protein